MTIKFSSKIDMPGGFDLNPKDTVGSNASMMTPDVIRLEQDTNAVISKLAEKYGQFKEQSFVGSGRQPVVGSVQGELPVLDSGSYREVYSQTPEASVIIKKRMFSSLKHLYNPIYMNEEEKWLYRASKRLVQRKCFIMAEYERLSKISKMIDNNVNVVAILANFIVDEKNADQSEAYKKLEAVIRARNPALTTTYYVNPFDPEVPDLGIGQGVFELATVSQLNTSLGIDSDGSCSFSIEDPNRILFVNDEDIEFSIKETRPSSSNVVKTYREKIAYSLREAQVAESDLNLSRVARNKSKISFEVSSNGLKPIATMEMTGQNITLENLDNIDSSFWSTSDQSLSYEEKELFKIVYKKLNDYSDAVLEGNLNNKVYSNSISESLNYVRNRMRMFYLGKYVIQPMDEIHIYIDSATRNFRENLFLESNKSYQENLSGSMDNFNGKNSSVISDSSSINEELDDTLLIQDYNNYVNSSVVHGGITFEEFKKLRILQLNSNSGTHVFAGLVKEVSDIYDANSGKYTLSVSGTTNMEWLRLSRYNKEPSLDQTQGLVNDPLTPMSFKLDSATGLPTGNPELSQENLQFVHDNKTFIPAGEKKGLMVTGLQDMDVGKEFIGGHSITTYQHVPGMVYKWKEGVMTAVYNLFSRDPKNLSLTDTKQLKRDMGFFWSNSAFDNLDSANIVSILVTGIPYNALTFIQSTKSSFIPNPSLDTSKDFFSTFLDFQSTNVKINGNFIPFKTISVSPEALAVAQNLQIRLTGFSSELKQLRSKSAEIEDKIMNFGGPGANAEANILVSSLKKQQATINERISNLQVELKEDISPEKIQNAVVQIAGDDVMFDFADNKDSESIKSFGDNLLYLTQRRKEDVIYNQDKNLFIVSDEYDKDYDIQAFVLEMKKQSPEMFKSTWMDVHQLCKKVAETLDFEFFADTQGHIVFRPPQYNRVPLSILKNMIQLYRDSGVKLISDSVLKLYVTREESIIRDIVSLEWEIAMNGALLGRRIVSAGSGFIFEISFEFDLSFILNSVWDINQGIRWSEATSESQRKFTLDLVKKSNLSTQLSSSSMGLFSSNLQQDFFKNDIKSQRESYDFAINQLSILKGIPVNNFEKFDKVSVGAKKNGQSTPSTDKSNVINKISELISRRARLLRTLEKIMTQVDEVGEVQNNQIQARPMFGDNLILNDLNRRFIEDDTKNYIGHMSGNRFIIKDEHIFSSKFFEKPPEVTTVTVKGGDAILGLAQEGTAIGTSYIAFGADFDMWRQYGWRLDKTYDRPYFTSAELQCAPYALMLLSRQRKNIITGELEVKGNEFYQLGDVVYVTERRLLYYVSEISHVLSYGSEFKTRLKLTYGHPPGDYIPTPLDIIGKMAIRQGSAGEYRMNRQVSNVNKLLGIIKYEANAKTEYDGNLNGKKSYLENKYFKQNYDSLIQSGTKAKGESVGVYGNSPKVFIVTYGIEEDNSAFQIRRKLIKDSITTNLSRLETSNKGEGSNREEVPSSGLKSDNMLASSAVIDMHIKIPEKNTERSPLEIELLQNMQFVASQEAYSFDPKLENVLEIRIVHVPNGGWAKWEKNYNS